MKKLSPGSTIGILGGGQLGRMLAEEARRMGYLTGVLDPTPEGPAAQVADFHIKAPLSDLSAAAELASKSDVVTLEWELIPIETLEKIEALKPVHPSSAVLKAIQDRLVQKKFLTANKLPQAPYAAVNSPEDLTSTIKGFPCRLKRRLSGYDGKGQVVLANAQDAANAGEILEAPCVLETHIPFQREISVILARGQDGATAVFPIAENVHRGGILHTTRLPAKISPETEKTAVAMAKKISEALGHVGVLAVEMFEQKDGTLLVNEIAPRVHNSGHATLGACATSQCEQHLRAICGLPLGDTALLTPAVMVNLMGELWAEGEPLWDVLRANPQVHLHLYGKAKPAPGRKMGHFLLLGPDTNASLKLADSLLAELAAKNPAPTLK